MLGLVTSMKLKYLEQANCMVGLEGYGTNNLKPFQLLQVGLRSLITFLSRPELYPAMKTKYRESKLVAKAV